MARDGEHIEIAGREVHRKGGGLLWHVEEADEDVWFPLSQVEISTDGASLLVPLWLANKHGLI